MRKLMEKHWPLAIMIFWFFVVLWLLLAYHNHPVQIGGDI